MREICGKAVLRFLTIRKFVSTLDARVGNYWVGEVFVTIFFSYFEFFGFTKVARVAGSSSSFLNGNKELGARNVFEPN